MLENMINLDNRIHDEIVLQYECGTPERQNQILNGILSAVPYLPCQITKFIDLLSALNLDESNSKSFETLINENALFLIKNQQMNEFLNFLRFLYLCEYTNIFTSNIEEIILTFDDFLQNIIISCDVLEAKKLSLTKKEKSVNIQFSFISFDQLFLQYTEKLTLIKDSTLNVSNGDVFIALYTIGAFSSQYGFCRSKLMDYFAEDFLALICASFLYSVNDSRFVPFFLPYFGKFQGFLKELYKYVKDLKLRPDFDSEQINLLLSNIYQSYYQDNKFTDSDQYTPNKNDQEIEMFKSFIDEDLAHFLYKLCNHSSLRTFLPSQYIKPESKNDKEDVCSIDLESFNDKSQIESMATEKFIKGLCKVGKPSVTHFLTYSEIYIDKLKKLSKDEQKQLVDEIYQVNNGNDVYIEVILEKLTTYGLITV